MKEELQFLEKLQGLITLARKNGQKITIEEVKQYFREEVLNEEQLALVFDYLLSQKIVVKGYLKMETHKEEQNNFSEEEKVYLREYLKEIAVVTEEAEGERNILFAKTIAGDDAARTRLTETYLKEVVEIAKEMHRPGMFLGDLVQEGNVGLIVGIAALEDQDNAHETILAEIRQAMQALLEEQADAKSKDEKMVEKVTMLNESIQTLTQELGRKVSIDELAVYTGMTEEEIEDVLRLLGEETEEEE